MACWAELAPLSALFPPPRPPCAGHPAAGSGPGRIPVSRWGLAGGPSEGHTSESWAFEAYLVVCGTGGIIPDTLLTSGLKRRGCRQLAEDYKASVWWGGTLGFSGVSHGLSAPSCQKTLAAACFALSSPCSPSHGGHSSAASLPRSVRLPHAPGPWPSAVAVLPNCGAYVGLFCFSSEWLSFCFTKECFLWNIFFQPESLPKTSWKIPHYFRNITVLPLTQHFCLVFKYRFQTLSISLRKWKKDMKASIM